MVNSVENFREDVNTSEIFTVCEFLYRSIVAIHLIFLVSRILLASSVSNFLYCFKYSAIILLWLLYSLVHSVFWLLSLLVRLYYWVGVIFIKCIESASNFIIYFVFLLIFFHKFHLLFDPFWFLFLHLLSSLS